jgi:hypothetical protein
MLFVPVVSSTGKPLMPCHPARARQLVRKGKALRRFSKGLFYIRLTERADGTTQPIGLGIDPGSKWEGFMVGSEAHDFLNINADAVTGVKDKIETRRNMRRTRRNRNTPYRKCRWNRATKANYDGFRLAPSTHARWDWKLRIAKWLSKLYPISCFIVEDIKARTKKYKEAYAAFGQKFGAAQMFNGNFSQLEQGKKWFYQELGKLAPVETKQGFETAEMRTQLGLKKLDKHHKSSKNFYAHCVDAWVLVNWYVGGRIKPELESVLCISPLQFKRRQLHKLQPAKGGIRTRAGSTNSLGFKRGSLVKHIKHGVMYVGGFLKDRLSLHSVRTGERLVRNAKPTDCTFLAHTSWRVYAAT